MVKQMKGHVRADRREELAEIIRSKATAIKRPNLETVMPENIERIRMLPMNRIACVACGVPLYVDSKNRTIQVADGGMPMGNGNGCKLCRGGGLRRPEDH